MRRTFWLASFACLSSLALLAALLVNTWSSADPGKEDKAIAAASRSAPQLPITGCALFSSGVGYIERTGEIEGSARVDLTFPVSDINDLLKSMVLQDMGGGRIDAVSYDSHDPIDKTLKSFAIDLTKNPTFGDILNQARGEKVEVVQQQAANQPGTLTGTVVGVEKQRQPAGKDAVVEAEVLNLWCAEGMRNVKLADVQRVRFLNPVMENEFRRALEVLAFSHDTQKKAFSLSFSGEGKRPVRVGYFQREGEIDGNTRVDLTFPVTDINDLLKSMVLQDLGGGHIDTVSYESHSLVGLIRGRGERGGTGGFVAAHALAG
jgi:hypothetical protein